MLPSILIVDDESEVLKALSRLLHNEYQVTTFTEPQKALEYFKIAPTHIVISDLIMPDIDGAEFLMKVAGINSRCKRIALTGFASAELAKKAVNDGKISHYLTKPWNNNELKSILSGLVEQLKNENRKASFIKKLSFDNQQLAFEQQSNVLMNELLIEEQHDSHKQLTQLKLINNELIIFNARIIAMYSKEPPGHSLRVAQLAKALALRLKLDLSIVKNIYISALFHRIGIASLSEPLLAQKGYQRSASADIEYYSYAQSSAQVMKTLGALKSAAKDVNHLYEQVNGLGIPDKLLAHEIPIGSKILRLIIDFDLYLAGELTVEKLSPERAFEQLKTLINKCYDPEVFNAFFAMYYAPLPVEEIQLLKTVRQLDVGMKLAQDLMDEQQHKLLTADTVLTRAHIENLQNIEQQQSIILYLYIYN